MNIQTTIRVTTDPDGHILGSVYQAVKAHCRGTLLASKDIEVSLFVTDSPVLFRDVGRRYNIVVLITDREYSPGESLARSTISSVISSRTHLEHNIWNALRVMERIQAA
jgi:hypothetical protein